MIICREGDLLVGNNFLRRQEIFGALKRCNRWIDNRWIDKSSLMVASAILQHLAYESSRCRFFNRISLCGEKSDFFPFFAEATDSRQSCTKPHGNSRF